MIDGSTITASNGRAYKIDRHDGQQIARDAITGERFAIIIDAIGRHVLGAPLTTAHEPDDDAVRLALAHGTLPPLALSHTSIEELGALLGVEPTAANVVASIERKITELRAAAGDPAPPFALTDAKLAELSRVLQMPGINAENWMDKAGLRLRQYRHQAAMRRELSKPEPIAAAHHNAGPSPLDADARVARAHRLDHAPADVADRVAAAHAATARR